MTHLGRKPEGPGVSRPREEVLREIVEQVDDEANPLSIEAAKELQRLPVPTNNADRAWFASLTPDERESVRSRALELYDGSRTYSASWKQAIAEFYQGAWRRPLEWH